MTIEKTCKKNNALKIGWETCSGGATSGKDDQKGLVSGSSCIARVRPDPGMDVETASAAPQESPVQKRPAEHEENGSTSPVPKRSALTAVTRAMPLIPQLHVNKCGSTCLFLPGITSHVTWQVTDASAQTERRGCPGCVPIN